MNRQQRRKAAAGAARPAGIIPPHLQDSIRNGAAGAAAGASGEKSGGSAKPGNGSSDGKDVHAKSAHGAPRKSLTVGMGGFDGLIHQLSNVPLMVNKALPLIERGEVAAASGKLTDALIKVELAKASILGNLALAAMKAGDISSAIGYVDIAVESLGELGLEDTEIGKMLAIVQANLPKDTSEVETAAATTGGEASAGTAKDDGAPARATEPSTRAPASADEAASAAKDVDTK